MAAYDFTRTPGGNPDDLDLGEGIDNGLVLEANDHSDLLRRREDAPVGADGRNATQRALDERIAHGEGGIPVDTDRAARKGARMDTDRIEGKAKELEGKLRDDESREAEGRVQGKWGKAKDKAGDMVDDLKDRVGDAVNERDEAPRRT